MCIRDRITAVHRHSVARSRRCKAKAGMVVISIVLRQVTVHAGRICVCNAADKICGVDATFYKMCIRDRSELCTERQEISLSAEILLLCTDSLSLFPVSFIRPATDKAMRLWDFCARG